MPQHSRTLRRLCASRSLSHTHKGILCTCLNFYLFPVFGTYLFDFKKRGVCACGGIKDEATPEKLKKQANGTTCLSVFV